MNKIIKFIKIKQKEKEYIKYIEEHKNNIRRAGDELYNCPALGELFMDEEVSFLFWERINHHDDSKFSLEEFDAYRRYYHPINREEKENAKDDFDKAWKHHLQVNDHHWESRKNKNSFDVNNNDDLLPLLENIADWLAMGYKFGDRPYQFYEKNKNKIVLCDKERQLLEKIIYTALEGKEVPTIKYYTENFSVNNNDSIIRGENRNDKSYN